MQLEHVVNFATHPISDPQYEPASYTHLKLPTIDPVVTQLAV